MNAEDWAFCATMVILLGAIVATATWGVIANRRADAEDAAQEQMASVNEHLQDEDRVWLAAQLELAGSPQPVWLAEDLAAAERQLRVKAQTERVQGLRQLNQDLRDRRAKAEDLRAFFEASHNPDDYEVTTLSTLQGEIYRHYTRKS